MILGKALTEYYAGERSKELIVWSSKAKKEPMDMGIFFSAFDDYNEVEKEALRQCSGHILDIGAGAGRHSLWLAENGHKVRALEPDPALCKLMRQRGLQDVVEAKLEDHNGKYDTLLLMMNGLGLAGYHDSLADYIADLGRCLAEGGQILADCSSIDYLPKGKIKEQKADEITFWFEYDGVKGEPFPWLFAEQGYALESFEKCGFRVEVLVDQPGERYLLQARRDAR